MKQLFTAARIRPGETQIEINETKLSIFDKEYEFDTILPSDSNQETLQQKLQLSDLIQQFKRGISQVIFCYGQTGSGKTYTINQIIPLIIKEIIEEQLEISCSVLQIYNEKILDMILKQQLKLRYKESEFVAENLTQLICHSSEEILKIFQKANKNRIIHGHALNDVSSRSHCIYTIYGKCQEFKVEFNIVDLAGSERLNQTKINRIQESTEINKSLFFLRQVIQNLADQNSTIPYRQSKLTSLLRKSLSRQSNIIMIICLNPQEDNLQQSQQSAQYGVKARSIKLQPELQVDKQTQLIKELKQQNMQLESKLRLANQTINKLRQQQQQSDKQNQNHINNQEILNQINQINQVLNENIHLRQIIKEFNYSIQQNEQTISILNNENQDLRDKINIMEDILSEDIKKDKNPLNLNWQALFQGQGSNFIEIIINKIQNQQFQIKKLLERHPQISEQNSFFNKRLHSQGKTQRSFSINKKEFRF